MPINLILFYFILRKTKSIRTQGRARMGSKTQRQLTCPHLAQDMRFDPRSSPKWWTPYVRDPILIDTKAVEECQIMYLGLLLFNMLFSSTWACPIWRNNACTPSWPCGEQTGASAHGQTNGRWMRSRLLKAMGIGSIISWESCQPNGRMRNHQFCDGNNWDLTITNPWRSAPKNQLRYRWPYLQP